VFGRRRAQDATVLTIAPVFVPLEAAADENWLHRLKRSNLDAMLRPRTKVTTLAKSR